MPDPVLVKSEPLAGDDGPTLVKSEPTEQTPSNHPYWAAATRIGGGVLSALTQPLEVTGFGTAVPAAISGGAEALAEKLEGSDLSPARIATEAALGAVPFGYLTKAGKLGKFLGQTGASMAKAGTIAGVGEGAREVARGEDLSPTSILAQGAIGASTYGLLSRILHGGTPSEPPPPLAPPGEPIITPGAGGNRVFRVPPNPKNPPPPAPTPHGIHDFSETIRTQLKKPVNDLYKNAPANVEDLATNVAEGQVAAAKTRAASQALEDKLQEDVRLAKEADLARKRSGLTVEDRTASQSQSGIDPVTGKRFTYTRRFSTPDADTEGATSAGTPDDLAISPDPNAPYGGVKLPSIAHMVPAEPPPPSTASVTPVEPVAPVVEPQPPVEPPQTPLAKVLKVRKRTSVRTPQGFQAAVDANLAQAGEPAPVTEAGNGGNTAPVAAPAEPPAPIAPVEPQVAPGTTIEPSPDSPLARVFKTRQGQTGYAYGMAKKAGITGEALAKIRDEHLVALGREPEGVAGLGEPTPDMVEQPSPAQRSTPAPDKGDGPDWVQEQLQHIASLQAPTKFDSDLGAINPKFIKVAAPIAGAVVGGPLGEYMDPEDPNAAVKGALLGASLGYGATSGVNGLIRARNAGLLATPAAQLKKPLSDFGAYLAKAVETPVPGQSRALLRELFNPANLKNAAAAFKNPDLAQDVIGDSARAVVPPSTGLMRQVTRPFAAAQYATSQAMERAGVTPEEARNVLFLGKPNFSLFQKWLDAQKLEGPAGQIVRAVRPFARIGTNIFERGLQRVPGLAYLAPKFDAAIGGDPETKLARTLLGGAAVAGGALIGANDSLNEDNGDEPMSPLVRGLRRAALASYGIPFMLGESLTGPRGIRDLIYATPGATQTIPPPGPKDNLWTYAKKFGKRWADQTVPDWLAPSTNARDSGIR